MSSAISNVGSYASAMMPHGMQGGPRGMKRPDATEMTEDLFSKLDTSQQGFLQASDLGDNGEALVSALDSDSDGKVTRSEMSERLQQIQSELDSQFQAMRTRQGMGEQQGMGGMEGGGMGGMGGPQGMGGGGMRPPPPDGEDQGLSQDQLSAMATSASENGDDAAAELFSQVASNFSAADTNGDGKVTFQESQAYRESQQASQSSDSSTSSASTASSETSQDNRRIMHQLMSLMRTYGEGESTTSSGQYSVAA